MEPFEARLKALLDDVQKRDAKLARELDSVRQNPRMQEKAMALVERAGLEGTTVLESAGPSVALETIVLRVGRPVLAIQQNAPRLEFRDAESQVWRQRLIDARERLLPAIQAVGRVEIEGHLRLGWIGTGWLVAEDIIITNRHVAREFGRGDGEGFVFKPAVGGGLMKPSIDFLQELERPERLVFTIDRILHIEDEDGPDMALLKVTRTRGSTLAAAIALAERSPERAQMVAVIGYPARDSRIPDQDLMRSIFGDVFDKKRLAPGQVIDASGDLVFHDCSTLGGNSGSVVLDLGTGTSFGLHYAGTFLEKNFAVGSAAIAERLDRVVRGTGKPASSRHGDRGDGDSRTSPNGAPLVRVHSVVDAGSGTVSLTIPVQLTIDIGTPRVAGATTGGDDTEREDEVSERRAEDYADREGYAPAFLGRRDAVPLPEVIAASNDVLTFDVDGRRTTELRYEHFSVVMSKRRRLCFFSAVNVDGSASRKAKRTGWLLDPRIPEEAQIKRECYGDEPKFSRGHMTRREDPVWGTPAEASRGNSDSMHVTNTVPQMQPFNAGIWLGLEDYALDHAREDDMRISVFTGPFLESTDPVRFAVKIPRAFWKVIAFVHDRTNRLCATGYRMSQEDFLREQEFVFGRHETAQVPIASIERQAGLSFGPLARLDPLAGQEAAVSGPLRDFSEIRFVG